MHIHKEDKPVIEWNFNSLELAIDTMFASNNLKAEYCSPQCRNKANVYKSREKINKENNKHE